MCQTRAQLQRSPAPRSAQTTGGHRLLERFTFIPSPIYTFTIINSPSAQSKRSSELLKRKNFVLPLRKVWRTYIFSRLHIIHRQVVVACILRNGRCVVVRIAVSLTKEILPASIPRTSAIYPFVSKVLKKRNEDRERTKRKIDKKQTQLSVRSKV